MDAGLEAFRRSVREFADAQIAPRAAEIDRANEFPADLWRKLGEAALHGLTIPKSHGGSDRGYLAHVLAMEEISRASGSVGLSYAAHSHICLDNLHRHGSDSQRRRYLPKLCAGEWVGALAMSEPEAGSDVVGSITCRAEKRGDTWVANGVKKWITNGPEADVVIVYMRSGEGPAGGLTAFIVERGMRGFRRGPRTDKLGMRGSNTCELVFENCEIPEDNVLGTAHEGVRVLMDGLDGERIVLAGGPLGLMQAALDAVLPFVRTRRQFGAPIGRFELMQAKLAEMYMLANAARAYVYRVAACFRHERAQRKDAAACYLFASQAAVKVALEAIQALGARGYLNDSPVSRLLRDAKVYDIGGGTSEIRRMLIGRELFEEANHAGD
jgi:isovaleryl-CoA dehydrogenase